MQIFVTGATGVLGRPVVRALAAAGHRVRALARSASNDDLLLRMGAHPVHADLFDPGSVREAVAGSEAVLHLATRIPPRSEARRPEAWADNNRLRIEGTSHLVDAALAAGASVFVYPSVCFVLRDGGSEWIDSSTTPADGGPLLASTLTAETEVERFAEGGGRGVTLRMGYFYGPEAESTLESLALARRGGALLVGSADAYFPAVCVDDAASAIVAAMERAPSGRYDVVDDEPLTRREQARAVAEAAGRPFLLRPPVWLMKMAAGSDTLFMARSQRVSNRAFRDATGWAPTVRDAREGWRRIAEALRQPQP